MKLWVPEAPTVVCYEEDSMAQRIHFDVRLHLPTDADVVSRLVTVKVTSADSTVRVLYDGSVDPHTEVLGRYWGYEGEVVTVTLIDVDDAGNRSEAVEVSYKLPDLTPPAKPIAPEIVVVGTDSDFTPPVDVQSADDSQNTSDEGQLEETHTSTEVVEEVSPEASEVVEEVSPEMSEVTGDVSSEVSEGAGEVASEVSEGAGEVVSEVSEAVVTDEHAEEEHVESDVASVDEHVDESLVSDVEDTDEHVDEAVADEGDTQGDAENEQWQ
jgi:hypothetical protein